MNPIELFKRKERPLEKGLIEVSGAVEPCNHDCDGFRMRSLRMQRGSRLRLHHFLTYAEFQYGLPRDFGWAVALEKSWFSKPRPIRIRCSVVLSGDKKIEVANKTLRDRSPRWWPLHFDWPLALKEAPDADLVVEVLTSDGENTSDAVIVGITEHFELRKPLLEYARGCGVEIGPGVSPQVLPAKNVDVKYLERSPVDDWERLYNSSGKFKITEAQRSLFPRYIVGDAQMLAVLPDHSIDFIFSSHVFEHLTNPIGTLEAWRRKLRDNGHVIGVVPDAHNCFDLLQPLSTEAQWLQEWRDGCWSYQDAHYDQWCRFTQPWARAAELRKAGFAIHAHYYSPTSFGQLMKLAVGRLGYRNFHLRSSRNHKDFGFVLQK